MRNNEANPGPMESNSRLSSPAKEAAKPPKIQRLKAVWPEVWKLMRPRRGLLALGFVLMVINKVAGFVLPYSSKFLIDNVVTKHQTGLLRPLVLSVLFATLVQGITSFSLTQCLSKAAQRLIADLREQVQAHISRLPVAFYDANKTGALVSRIMSDVEGVRNLLGTGLVDFAGGLVAAGIALALLLRISAPLTLIAVGSLGCFALALNRAFATIRPIFRERGKINAEVTGRLTESLGGVRVIKGYHAEKREESIFAAGVRSLLDNVMRTLTATSLMGLSASVLLGGVGAATMYVGGRQMAAHTLSPGSYFSYNFLLVFLIAPVMQVVSIGTQLTEALAGLERTQEIMGERPEDQDPNRSLELRDIVGTVEFKNVTFSYEGTHEVLRDISFRAEPGTVTALVGSSGSGKSTTIGLISAFYIPTKGRILVDGTIRENVMFSRPGASEEEFLRACRIARVDEFAESFADKYDTVVGERGVKLSGGQRQRISIAPAILAAPRILILDEATSSLDSESEQMIQHGLSYLMQGRTTFVIAHRLSTIRRADQILVMEQGQIVERGTHEELFALQGRYYDLYTRQHGVEENLFLAPGEGDIAEGNENGSGGSGPTQNGDAKSADALRVLK